jgi:hypothetical protein
VSSLASVSVAQSLSLLAGDGDGQARVMVMMLYNSEQSRAIYCCIEDYLIITEPGDIL